MHRIIRTPFVRFKVGLGILTIKIFTVLKKKKARAVLRTALRQYSENKKMAVQLRTAILIIRGNSKKNLS